MLVSLEQYQAYHKKQIEKKQKLLVETSHNLTTKELKKISSEIINHKKSIGFSKSGKLQIFAIPASVKP